MLRIRISTKEAGLRLEVEEVAKEFKFRRQETARILKELADKLNNEHNDACIVKTVGGAASIIGTGLFIGGIVSSLFTFGASLTITAIGAGIGAAGGVTTAAGFLSEFTSRLSEPSISKALEEDRQAFDRLTAALQRTNFPSKPIDRKSVLSYAHRAGGGSLDLSGLRVYEIKTPFSRSLQLIPYVVKIPQDLNMVILSFVKNRHDFTVYELVQKIYSLVEFIKCPEDNNKSAPPEPHEALTPLFNEPVYYNSFCYQQKVH